MNILIFSHSGSAGGAEHALRRFVGLLMGRHEMHIMLPTLEGSEARYYESIGVSCYRLPAPLCLPNFSNTLLEYAQTDFKNLAETLKRLSCDIAISNTIAMLHGGILSKFLEIPHITYAHEFLFDEELMPTSISKECYIEIIENLSTKIISCSDFVSDQFSFDKHAQLKVLPPYDYALEALPRKFHEESEFVIQVIGTKSIRKNTHFAVTLIKSLALRGLNVRLDLIGSNNTGTNKLSRALQKRNINHRIIPSTPSPFDININSTVVTLVCSTSEPYGLTIPESLRLGIPVIASRSGGPSEILSADFLYDVNDLDECARKVEKIFASYKIQVEESKNIYELLRGRQLSQSLEMEIDASLCLSQENVINNSSFIFNLMHGIKQALDLPIGIGEVAENISKVYFDYGVEVAPNILLDWIEHESMNPGAAVLEDIRVFDVIPFAMSSNMDTLYKHGMGLAIELASTFNDVGRLQMAAFILCALNEMQKSKSKSIKILALGDGIAIDTIRIAMNGFSIDYIDYDGSNMSKIAELNIATAKFSQKSKLLDITVIDKVERKYDAIICLEVIEHVASPLEFSGMLSDYLSDDGSLFISECFDGIQNRWPTHLYSNEKYSGMLPFLLLNQFKLSNNNKMPYGKPYVFSKRPVNEYPDLQELLLDRLTMAHLIVGQNDLGL